MITETEILKKYPELYQEHLIEDKMQTCFWGLEVPEDWLPVIDQLSYALTNCGYTGGTISKKPIVIAEQVKSKFNSLRFYYRLEFTGEVSTIDAWCYNSYINGMITMAESMIGELEFKRRQEQKKLNTGTGTD